MPLGSLTDISAIMCLVIPRTSLAMCALGSRGFNRWLIRPCSWLVRLTTIPAHLSSDGLGNVPSSSRVVLCKLLSGPPTLRVRLCIKLWVVIRRVRRSRLRSKWCRPLTGVTLSRTTLLGTCRVAIERTRECLLRISAILPLAKFRFVLRSLRTSLTPNEKQSNSLGNGALNNPWESRVSSRRVVGPVQRTVRPLLTNKTSPTSEPRTRLVLGRAFAVTK